MQIRFFKHCKVFWESTKYYFNKKSPHNEDFLFMPYGKFIFLHLLLLGQFEQLQEALFFDFLYV